MVWENRGKGYIKGLIGIYMKITTLEDRSTAVGTAEERVFLGSSTFSGVPLFIEREKIDPITGRPHRRFWGKMITPAGPYVSPDGQKQAENYQKYVSSLED